MAKLKTKTITAVELMRAGKGIMGQGCVGCVLAASVSPSAARGEGKSKRTASPPAAGSRTCAASTTP